MKYVQKDDSEGCWNWIGAVRNGYGYLGLKSGGNALAHRLSYEWHKGPIPAGMQIDHLCRNRGCVNPDHLEAVTPLENTHRSNTPSMVVIRSGHCQRGHDLTVEANVYTAPDRRRNCRICRDARLRRRYGRADDVLNAAGPGAEEVPPAPGTDAFKALDSKGKLEARVWHQTHPAEAVA